MERTENGLSRRRSKRMIAGVAGGVADALGVPASYVRAAFLTLASVWGLGGIIYAAFWAYAHDQVADRAPKKIEHAQRLGLALAFVGLMGVFAAVGLWPPPAVVLVTASLSFGWAALSDRDAPRPLAALLDPTVSRPSRLRVALGLALVFLGITLLSSQVGPVMRVSSVFVAVIVTAAGVMVAFGPLVRRLLADLARERNERIRQEERAEVAAHLHDSVLQTLALIQRTEDPARVAMLARHQETELRDWLYGTAPLEGLDTVATALRVAARRVEEDHQTPVDVVVVGDHPLDTRTQAMVGAATEAMVNAARHSGSNRVSVFFEAGEELTVYVSDQGRGFDPAAVAPDRRGLSDSIVARMERAGGDAQVATEVGEGTEIVLRVVP